MKSESNSIILFDGVCNLCCSSVQFVIRHDRSKHFKFTSLQSEKGQSLLNKHHLNSFTINSFVLIIDGRVYTHSTAVLQVAKKLSGGWSFFYVFIFIPKSLRDAVYSFIAQKRYKWFGKKTTCWIPSPEINSRFIN